MTYLANLRVEVAVVGSTQVCANLDNDKNKTLNASCHSQCNHHSYYIVTVLPEIYALFSECTTWVYNKSRALIDISPMGHVKHKYAIVCIAWAKLTINISQSKQVTLSQESRVKLMTAFKTASIIYIMFSKSSCILT